MAETTDRPQTKAAIRERLLGEYLQWCESRGGTRAGFREWLDREGDAHLSEEESEILFGNKWDSESKLGWGLLKGEEEPEQLSLAFTVDGHSVQATFTFEDPTVPGGHRVVTRDFAKVAHVVSDEEISWRNVERAKRKAEEKTAFRETCQAKPGVTSETLLRDLAD